MTVSLSIVSKPARLGADRNLKSGATAFRERLFHDGTCFISDVSLRALTFLSFREVHSVFDLLYRTGRS